MREAIWRDSGGATGSGTVDEQARTFGPFRLLPKQRMLYEAGRPVRVGSRALHILVILVECAGEIVSKDELISRVWPEAFVDEANLRVHIAALRRVLGDGQSGTRYIANIIGRGYSFVADVSLEREASQTAEPTVAAEPSYNLPPRLSRMIGRAEVVSTLGAQVRQRRFVTIVGSPGIGKTTVALAVAEYLTDFFEHKVRFVDFGSGSDATLLQSVLARVLGIAVLTENATQDILNFLIDKKVLLVLDNCEHVVDAAAELSENILKGALGVHILATSREPLRAEGEWVQRLEPLGVPPALGKLSVAEAIHFPAMELFIERASSSHDTFELTEPDVEVVAQICRHLNGIPLAIELVAARVDMFGVRELAALIEDRFLLLTQGLRTALPRQQTIGATLDWSYSILPPSEQAILRRISIFSGAFTMESATAVAASGNIDKSQVFEGVVSLTQKSLIVVDTTGDEVQYRLLEMTRTYAIEKLSTTEESLVISQLHARYFCDFMRWAKARVQTGPKPE